MRTKLVFSVFALILLISVVSAQVAYENNDLPIIQRKPTYVNSLSGDDCLIVNPATGDVSIMLNDSCNGGGGNGTVDNATVLQLIEENAWLLDGTNDPPTGNWDMDEQYLYFSGTHYIRGTGRAATDSLELYSADGEYNLSGSSGISQTTTLNFNDLGTISHLGTSNITVISAMTTVLSNLAVLGSSATVDGKDICLDDGTNCMSSTAYGGQLQTDINNSREYLYYNGSDFVSVPAMFFGSSPNASIGTDALVLDYNRNGTDGPNEFPVGFYTQPTESDVGVQGGDWLYDGSIVWGINPIGDSGNYRHFQMSTFFDGSYASFRVKNATNNNWLPWRLFAVDNAVAEFTFGGDANVVDDLGVGFDGEPESDVKIEVRGDNSATDATQILFKNRNQGGGSGIQFEAWTTCTTSDQELGKIFTRFTGCHPTTGEMVFQVPYGNFGSNGMEEAMWIRNTEIEMNNTLQVGNANNPLNITMFSPDGSEWTCGVNNSGSWSCS